MTAQILAERTPVIELVDVHRRYTTGSVAVDVLQGVNLQIHPGELSAVMGPSGSGKSTLMNIIGLLDRPTSGTYILKGRPIESMRDDEIAALRNASIGFVFQSFHLLARLNAWQNVGLPLVYRGAHRTEIRHRAMHMLEKVGLDVHAAHRPSELSGGQRQRVAIARALVGDPELLLADEPTGALDTDTGHQIMRLLIELNETEQTTTVVITHDHAIAAQCRRRLRIRNGQVREQPSAPEPKR